MTAAEPRALLLRDAEIEGQIVDVRIVEGRVAAIDPRGATPPGADRILDVAGGAVLPGLHDHHVHLLAMAAWASSIDVRGRDFDAAIATDHAQRPAGDWQRVVGYDETVTGPVDRHRLDALAPGRPVRVQHRSGALWILSSAALDQVLPDDGASSPAGVERDETGRPTGRLFRLDDWLGARIPRTSPPDLETVGRRLVARGVTGVTDATPTTDPADFLLIAQSVARRDLPIHVTVTGAPSLASLAAPPPLLQGPVKVVITDHSLPALDDLELWFDEAHRAGRNVAVHCVSDVALVLALAAWDEVGARPGDRIEHGAVVHPEHVARVAAHGLTVVTQPAFVFASGDRYLADVDPVDVPYLYPCRSLQDAGVLVGGSSDAPFGPDDPWLAVASAVERRTASGAVLGAGERVTPEVALSLFLSSAADPGGVPRTVEVGAPADLCVLDVARRRALEDPANVAVRATISDGDVVYLDEGSP